jgi:hypothetical protein
MTPPVTLCHASHCVADKLFKQRAAQLARALVEEGLASAAGADSGPLTCTPPPRLHLFGSLLTCRAHAVFKLAEWSQVEIVQLLANSLEHTPW